MEQFLVQHGGIWGISLVVILLLVREVVGEKSTKHVECTRDLSDMMTKDLCEERHSNINKSISVLREDIKGLRTDIKDLPRRLSGGAQ